MAWYLSCNTNCAEVTAQGKFSYTYAMPEIQCNAGSIPSLQCYICAPLKTGAFSRNAELITSLKAEGLPANLHSNLRITDLVNARLGKLSYSLLK